MRRTLFAFSSFTVVLATLVAVALGAGTQRAGASGQPPALRDTWAWAHLSGPAQAAILRHAGVRGVSAGAQSTAGPAVATGASDHSVNNLTADASTTQSETTIAASGSTIVAGYNDSLNGQYTGYSVSTNSGGSWTDDGYLTPLPSGSSPQDLGDPALAVDTGGHFYFAQLAQNSNGEFVTLSKCSVSGSALSCGTPIQISNTADGVFTFNDKEYIAYDHVNNRVYVTWTYFGAFGSTTLELRYYNVATGGLSSTYNLTSMSAQGTNPVVTGSGLVYVFFEGFPGSGHAIDYVTFNNGTISGVHTIANINAAAGNISCGGQTQEAFSTEAFSTANAARENEFPAGVVDGSGNLDVTWNAAPTAGGISTIYVATLPSGGTTWRVLRLANPTNLIQWQPWVAVAGTKLAVTYFQVVNTSAGYQIERVQANATTGGAPSFGAAFPISAQSWAADKTNPNFDSSIAACYMGDYSASVGSGSAIYSVWGDNRNATSGIGPQPDIYGAVH